MTEQTAYRNSYETLRTLLPEVFDLRDVTIALDTERAYAKIYCSRWVSRSMAAPLGPRAGVFFNLVKNPTANKTKIMEGVTKLIGRDVVVIGASALHQHGWTTQRPQSIEIAVPVGGPDRAYPQMHGIIAVPRKREWFHAVLPTSAPGIGGFKTANPEYALVDTIVCEKPRPKDKKQDIWRPRPSDIDLPSDADPEEAIANIMSAAETLGGDLDQVRDFIAEVEGLEDRLPTP